MIFIRWSFCNSLFCRRLLKKQNVGISLNKHFTTLIELRLAQQPKNLLPLFNLPLKSTSNKAIHVKMSGGKLEDVADVEIDHGRFKYILIKIYESTPNGEEKSKYIVRGYNWAAYHADIFDHVDKKLKESGLDSECVGGGRILHDMDKKCLSVYGYSTGYGKADHEITTEILKKKYPDYGNISWSNEGY